MKALLFLIFSFCALLDAKVQKDPRYHLSVCALFKNESRNLREWIEYHRLIGVDHFYLYENGSSDRYLKVLRPYINRRIVTLVPWPNLIEKKQGEKLYQWALTTQIQAFENAMLLYAKKESKWLVFLDVDEFIVPMKDTTLSQVLLEYEDEPGISLQSEFFDASSQGVGPSSRLAIESVDITKKPETEICEAVEKMIFQPALYRSSTWPPYQCVFQDDRKAKSLDPSIVRVNKYLNRNFRMLNFRRKVYADPRKMREKEKQEILDLGYDIEDQERSIHRFLPELTKKLNATPH
jgi:hypothetical protein